MDIALWDIAGKFYDEPLYRLLGGEKRPLKAYASTLHGDENGGLTTPQHFEDFAQQCLEMGYKVFKVHGWGLARASNTQPVLVMRFEAKTEDQLKEYQQIVYKQLEQYQPDVQVSL